MIKTFTLGPVQRIKINIPAGMEIINPGQPKLASTGDIKITTAAVHGKDTWLLSKTMLERAKAECQTPIDSVPDLEEVLTRGLPWVDCDYLLTGILLRRDLHDSDGGECVLYLVRDGDRWVVDFYQIGRIFGGRCQVLCYGN